MFLLVLLPAGLHKEGIRCHTAPGPRIGFSTRHPAFGSYWLQLLLVLLLVQNRLVVRRMVVVQLLMMPLIMSIDQCLVVLLQSSVLSFGLSLSLLVVSVDSLVLLRLCLLVPLNGLLMLLLSLRFF